MGDPGFPLFSIECSFVKANCFCLGVDHWLGDSVLLY